MLGLVTSFLLGLGAVQVGQASEVPPAPRLERAVLMAEDGYWRLGLSIVPSYAAEVDVAVAADRLLVGLPDVDGSGATIEGDGLALAPAEEGSVLALTPEHAGGAASLDLRAVAPRKGESMAFALGPTERLAVLPALVPLPAPRPAALAAAAAAGPRPFTVVIDPGHGGHDPGAVVDGIVEKKLTLVFARRLALRLSSLQNTRAVLTREGDRFLPLGARLRLAIAEGADLFISLHADTVAEGNASGLSVYTLTPERREAVAGEITAEAPRDAIIRGVDLAGAGDDVTRILVELSQRRTGAEGEDLAAAILEGMGETVPLLNTRPHRQANFRVLRSVDFPAILVELGFLSNAGDRKRLTDRRWQAMAAERMAVAIDGWRRRRLATPDRQN
ncbi:MAG: N-acetylmuramoyl-L-alanine amidase [Pseudomonadota bacterium]